MTEYICKYCGKICKNTNSLAQHECRCKSNPNKIDMSYIKPGHSKGHKGSNQFIKAEQLGLEKPKFTQETINKIREKSLQFRHTEESKQKISNGVKLAISRNPESYNASNVNGRVKHFLLNGFKIDGKWELDVAKYLNDLNIEWVKPLTSFEYIWNNTIHKYFPDFYLPEYDRYIEVKGYERDRDLVKYKSVQNLILIKKKEIDLIHNNKFNIFDLLK